MSPEAFEGVTAIDLVGLGFEQDVADSILAKVSPESGSSEPPPEEPATEEKEA